MGTTDHLTCLLRNLYAGQEATVRTGHGTTDWFQIGKGVCQDCILHPAYLTYVQNTSWKMPGCMKHKLESRLKSLSHVWLLATHGPAPGFSVLGILQARILEWVAISFSRGFSRPRDRTWVSCIAGRCFTIWATREAWLLGEIPIPSDMQMTPAFGKRP